METVQTGQPAKLKKFGFDVRLNWLSETTGVLSATDAKGVIRVATPPAFGGTGTEWSPEHLLIGSVSSCFMSTYLSFAKKFRFEISRMECYAEGMVEMATNGWTFTKIVIRPRIYVDNYDLVNKARLVLEKAEKYCLVSNSLNIKVECCGDVIEEKHKQ